MAEPHALTFEDDDKLSKLEYCQRLEPFLLTDHNFSDGSLVVSLNAPFGTGKTTFLEMWKNDLIARRGKGRTDLPIVVMLNAWENDFCGDPLISVVSGLLSALEEQEGVDKSDIEKLKDAASDVGLFVTGLANQFVSHWTGIDAMAAGESVEAANKVEKPNFVDLYDKRSQALNDLKNQLHARFGGDEPSAIIMVDELDRCRPDYAISYLETVKHVFDIHGLIFVLAIDYDHLKNSARALFGRDLKFDEYLRKFVQRSLTLPPMERPSVNALCSDLIEKYFHRDKIRYSQIDLPVAKKNIPPLAAAFDLTPRQIKEALRVIGHTLEAGESEKGQRYAAALSGGVIFMALLKFVAPRLYNQIGNEEEDPKEVAAFLKSRIPARSLDYWLGIYLTGSPAFQGQDGIDIPKFLVEVGLAEAEEKVDMQRIGAIDGYWNLYFVNNRLAIVYRWMETALKLET